MILQIFTCAVCSFCIFVFLFALCRYLPKLIKLNSDVCLYPIEQMYDESKPLNKVLSNYFKTVKNGFTTEYAADYITIESLSIIYKIKLKVFASIPHILTSLGILGTFIGLSIALFQFDSSNSESIRISINYLLEGMSTAFWTSVAGMATSCLFLYIERRFVNITENNIDVLCSKLDIKFHKSPEQVIIESFTQFSEDNEIMTPADSLSMIIDSIKKMKTSLEVFSTDLCDSIGNAMDSSFENRLLPMINDLASKLENPAQTVTNSLVYELKNICESFKDNLTESINNQMDDLLERLIDASNAINNIPEVIDSVSNAFISTTNNTLHAHEEISKSFDEQLIRITDLSVSFSDVLERMTMYVGRIEAVNSLLANIPDTVNKASEAIGSASDNLKESNEEVSEILNSIQDVNTTTLESVQEYSNNINQIQIGLSSIFKEINDGLVKYAEATKNGLQKMLDPFTNSVSDATLKVANSIAPLNDAVDELGTFGDVVTKSLKDLSGVISNLESSIKRLQQIANHEKM